MNNEIEVSVIIPCFNDGEYLEETVASINAQTFKELEIIIVDDASTDENTLKILQSFQQKNLKVMSNLKNSGPSVSRNKGIFEAKGKYILPVDADDTISPTYIEKAKKILESDSHIGIVYCEASLFGEKQGLWELEAYRFPEILTGNMIFATALYRKADWEAVGGYNENMRYGNEDYDFWLSLIEKKLDVYRIPEVLFQYRIKASSRTTQLAQNQNHKIETLKQIFLNHKALYVENIEVIFSTLDRQHQSILLKDKDIRNLHELLQDKDKDIKMIHVKMYEKDKDIHELHQTLNEKYMYIGNLEKDMHQLGQDLTYARQVVNLRDRQIAFLNTLTLKRRLKHQLKKYIPTKLLTFFGFTAYVPLVLPVDNDPQEDITTEIDTNVVKTYTYTMPTMSTSIEDKIENFEKKPLISIVMPVYNVNPIWLEKAIKSIENQWYTHWELCLADDKSTNKDILVYLESLNHPQIKITYLEQNLNISGATNAALTLTNGEYIALMDNDDEITPDALYEIVKAINDNGADFIYSDEDFISTEGKCSNPHYKPDFSPDLLLSHNYITHFTCFSQTLLSSVGTYNSDFDGAQDYDLFLRLTEQAKCIYHIKKVLYHWRTLETSTSANAEAKPEALMRGKFLIEAAMQRRGIDARVENANISHYFRVRYTIKNNPLISIVIPFKDKPELLDMCIHSILEKSTYQHYEIIGISNNSEENETFEMMKILESKDNRISFYEYNVPFNYSDINNYAVNTYAKGEHILLLNNDIEIISPDWLESMLELSQREEIGCVGAKLYYPNDTVQHAGIIMGLGGYAGHSHKMSPRTCYGYFNRLNVIQNLSAVTAACLMVKKSIYKEMHGLDEVAFKVAYNDVDFCLRVQEAGYHNIFTPYAEAYHHESISRGYEETPEKIARFQKEKDALYNRHKEILENGDPYYNPHLTHAREDFSLCLN